MLNMHRGTPMFGSSPLVTTTNPAQLRSYDVVDWVTPDRFIRKGALVNTKAGFLADFDVGGTDLPYRWWTFSESKSN